jgi:hypothetical protein
VKLLETQLGVKYEDGFDYYFPTSMPDEHEWGMICYGVVQHFVEGHPEQILVKVWDCPPKEKYIIVKSALYTDYWWVDLPGVEEYHKVHTRLYTEAVQRLRKLGHEKMYVTIEVYNES